ITCASVVRPLRGHLPYVVSKGGLSHLTRTLAVELAPLVRVNAVAPGTVLPPPGYSKEQVERLAVRTALGRIGTPEDVADAVVFLADAPFVTGTEIVVDGGASLLE
ncbi:MAG: SDR family oxidoreductase, partial [Myxococcales bacterium]|nr:SDR family oxidoreductase [Myxococcales bacterium]